MDKNITQEQANVFINQVYNNCPDLSIVIRTREDETKYCPHLGDISDQFTQNQEYMSASIRPPIPTEGFTPSIATMQYLRGGFSNDCTWQLKMMDFSNNDRMSEEYKEILTRHQSRLSNLVDKI